MFTALNCGHQHEKVIDAKRCIGLAPWPSVPEPAPEPTLSFKDRPGSASDKQRAYLRKLGATPAQIPSSLTMNEASALITEMLSRPAEPSAFEHKEDKRVEFIQGILPNVPDGYFAVRNQDGDPYRFYRISTPKTGKLKGARKIQSQHSDYLKTIAVHWPSGAFSTYRALPIDHLMLIIADSERAAMNYARELGKCCRCNAALTDERSRHYGIGPECEKYWPQIIERVDQDELD